MPPQRTAPPKSVKAPPRNERTHEENQERAYIAASRRSDRSLEARLESARRASDIHKKRTGRALRVTEEDVVNEEMYEEEDDDVPMAYRGLTSHLNNGNNDWNRRMQAYLQNSVAMRSIVDQTLHNAYPGYMSQGMRFQNPSMYYPFPQHQYQNNPHMLPLRQQQQQQPQYVPAHRHSYSAAQGQQLFSPGGFQQQPYPTTAQRQQARAMSISQIQGQQQQGFGYPHSSSYLSSNTPINGSWNQIPTPAVSPVQKPKEDISIKAPSVKTEQETDSPLLEKNNMPTTSPSTMYAPPPNMPFQRFEQQMPMQHGFNGFDASIFDGFPLTTALPTEAQHFLQPSLDPNDPLYSSLMAGADTNQFYSWGNNSIKQEKLEETGMTPALIPNTWQTPTDMKTSQSILNYEFDPLDSLLGLPETFGDHSDSKPMVSRQTSSSSVEDMFNTFTNSDWQDESHLTASN